MKIPGKNEQDEEDFAKKYVLSKVEIYPGKIPPLPDEIEKKDKVPEDGKSMAELAEEDFNRQINQLLPDWECSVGE